MKKHVLKISGVLMAMVFLAACNDKDPITEQKVPLNDCNYKQRWIMKDYPNTMKIFTDSLVYTVYDIEGTFGEIEDAIPNPRPVWTIGDSLFIQRTRTALDRYKLDFRCDCQVMDLTNYDGFVISFYREGFDKTKCP